MSELEFTDRYQALGMPYPDPDTMCPGQCEGIGWVPVQANDDEEGYRQRWTEAEAFKPSDDGWHFVKCLTCNGSRKAK